jgi:hypothetical protein
MIEKLLALKRLVTPIPSQPAHAELDHSHWDAATRTWRPHSELPPGKEAERVPSNLNRAP